MFKYFFYYLKFFHWYVKSMYGPVPAHSIFIVFSFANLGTNEQRDSVYVTPNK